MSVANLLAVNHGLVEPPEKTLIAQDHQFRDPAYIKVGSVPWSPWLASHDT